VTVKIAGKIVPTDPLEKAIGINTAGQDEV